MTYDEARRRLERSTDFEFVQGKVLVRSPRLLASVDALRREDAMRLRLTDRQPILTGRVAQAA